MNSCSDVLVFSFLLCSVRKMVNDVVISTTSLSEHLPAFSLSHLTQLLNRSLMHSHSLFVLFSYPQLHLPLFHLSPKAERQRQWRNVKTWARFQNLFPGHLPRPTLCTPPPAPSLLPTQNHSSVSSLTLCNLNTCTLTQRLIRFSMIRASMKRVICGHFMFLQHTKKYTQAHMNVIQTDTSLLPLLKQRCSEFTLSGHDRLHVWNHIAQQGWPKPAERDHRQWASSGEPKTFQFNWSTTMLCWSQRAGRSKKLCS